MHDPATEPALFQQSFGAALAGADNAWLADPATARALTVHRNTSARAAQDALGDNYPVVRSLVGDEPFFACAAGYVTAHPPRDPRLCFYGEDFDRFLAAYRPFRELPYLPDLAALERMCTEVLFAADAAHFDGGAFDLEQPLPFHPAARFARFASPAVAIWLAHQPGAEPNAIEAVEWGSCAALVTRPHQMSVIAIDAPTAAFVENCADGATLTQAASAAMAAGGELSTIFAALIVSGAFQNQPEQGTI
jgi:hypothetical protein